MDCTLLTQICVAANGRPSGLKSLLVCGELISKRLFDHFKAFSIRA